ncbi:ATP-dependent carboxylate-amine ligase [Microtetraspora sp. AC03309]|uniref:MvdC/MvdD family ATP grasp protein n=1 Tax=Microtetraspora sp. AC03309 TaxID=2779376 RepID=UPI001E444A2A|nr:ATP-dependent carboxylate-amine ligase [Microtetraspora sp. AC03309]MCC5577455.1 ATP-dependent carboxylate-amine ligase [Microtetraspora sp. AC03309]
MQTTIVVLTGDDDEHADHITPLLSRRGAEVVRVDPASFPREVRVSSGFYNQAVSRWGTLDLASLTAVWYRRPGRPRVHDEIVDDPARLYVETECRHLAQDLWDALDCRFVPARRPLIDRAQRKLLQMPLAARLGFETPATLVTTDPDEFLAFSNRFDGQIITKPYAFAPAMLGGAGAVRYTERTAPIDLGYADALRFCPVIAQELIAKRVEVRVTVVGGRVFAAEIHSQNSNRSRTDWRSYDLRRTPHLSHRLPADVERRCLALVSELGLNYGAIDLIVTPEDRYVFLEINPAGQYLWIEQLTGLPISEALCDLLLEDGRA